MASDAEYVTKREQAEIVLAAINKELGRADTDPLTIEYMGSKGRVYERRGSKELSPRLDHRSLLFWLWTFRDGIDAHRESIRKGRISE